jgi:hypothetical protein
VREAAAALQIELVPLLHGPAEIATRGRLKSPPEAGGNRHPGAVDLLGGWGSPLSLTSK